MVWRAVKPKLLSMAQITTYAKHLLMLALGLVILNLILEALNLKKWVYRPLSTFKGQPGADQTSSTG